MQLYLWRAQSKRQRESVIDVIADICIQHLTVFFVMPSRRYSVNYSSSLSLSIPCIALRSASFSCSSAKLTRRDLLSKGLGFTCINPLLAQREILLAGMPNFPAATFIVTHCSAIKKLLSHRTWILYHRKQYK